MISFLQETRLKEGIVRLQPHEEPLRSELLSGKFTVLVSMGLSLLHRPSVFLTEKGLSWSTKYKMIKCIQQNLSGLGYERLFIVNVKVEFLFRCVTNTWYGLWDLDDAHTLIYALFTSVFLHQCFNQGYSFQSTIMWGVCKSIHPFNWIYTEKAAFCFYVEIWLFSALTTHWHPVVLISPVWTKCHRGVRFALCDQSELSAHL